jgi:MinD-like ATPase involved in chromosome partitioning or flagellar assembly
VTGDASGTRPLNVVERALRAQPGATGFRDPVVVVPGGHRPGKPDQVQRDQARARMPLAGAARIVVLGCTAGAGQTVTTLLTGQLLASLRGEAVAVVDLNPGERSLTQQARFVPALMPSRLAGADPGPVASAAERGLQVVTATDSTDDPGQIISAVAARYPLTLADPEASCVPRTLRAADQLILVVPASAEAPDSLAVTLEWLEAHDHNALAAAAITVLNGVNPQSAAHAERAAAVASGRSRAIVRVPWDQRMHGRQALGTGTVQAYTALAGVLIASLADAAAQPGRGR